MRRISIMAKCVCTAVVALAVIGVISSLQRTSALLQSAPLTDTFNGRYSDNPILTLMHVLLGLIFFVLGPLQFVTKIRTTFPTFHRWSGRVFVLAGIAVSISAYVLVYTIGLAGPFEVLNIALFASLLLVFLGLAIYKIRRREVVAHREWMIRAFALGLASASLRLIFLVAMAATNFSFADSFLIALWISFPLHLIVAEWWIRATRKKLIT